MMARYCDAGAAHVVVSGHPVADVLPALASQPQDAEFAGFAAGRRTVFWNPHFNVQPDGSGLSTFLDWQEFLLSEFARRSDMAFIFRPHPLLFGALEARGIWKREQIDAFLAKVTGIGNVLVDRRPSPLPVMAAADAMLSDASSLLLEYGATGRPSLYLRNPRGPLPAGNAPAVLAQNCTAVTREEISAFLDMVADGQDAHREARRAAWSGVLTRPEDGVAHAICRHVLTQLAQEARVMR
jgi:CDP-glycerol glycerophosphotransferase (TagB/SpsB family)